MVTENRQVRQTATQFDRNVPLRKVAVYLFVVAAETQTTESLSQLRKQIDECDDNIIQELAKRMRVAREIGTYKKEHGITVLQAGRYNEILEKRGAQGEQCGMSADFMKLIFEAIHEESVRQQIEIINK
mgnify:CR=1 FL=1